VIADSFDGKRLNSPNDVVVKSDGTIWFTDPHYGIATNYEGYKSEQELPCQVYRVDPASGSITAVLTDFNCPNGLAFSPSEDRLYVADTGRLHKNDPNHVRVFDCSKSGKLSGGDIFHSINPGKADGIRLDTDGNVWSSAGDGVHCLNPDGRLLGKILIPEIVSNICFGGRAKHQLFITGTTSVYTVILNREGVQRP
jgi:gluconolactonase